MKTPALLLALLLPFAAFAQEIVPGAEASVNIQLTGTYTETITDTAPTETALGVLSYRITTERFQNLQLLTELIEQGVIDDLPANAKNWRLVLVNRSPLLTDDDEVSLAFYAKRVVTSTLTAIPPVLIPENILRIEFTDFGGETATIRSNLAGVVSDSGRFVQQAILVYNNTSLNERITLRGVAKGTFASGSAKIGTETFTFMNIRAVTISSIVGEFENLVDTEDKALVTGSITFSAFKAVDIASYPTPVE